MTLPCADIAPGWPQTKLGLRSKRENNWWNPSSVSKKQQGVRRFQLRGVGNATAEWTLLATAFNLRTLWRVWRTRQTDYLYLNGKTVLKL